MVITMRDRFLKMSEAMLNIIRRESLNMSDTEKMTKTILTETIFKIKPFHKVRIADPWHLQQMESGKNVAGIKKLMADFTIPTEQHVAKVHLRKTHLVWESDSMEDDMWELFFYSVLDSSEVGEFPKMAFDNMIYPDLIEQIGDLGCDSARYHVVIDGRDQEVYNGGDGYFGHYFTYKDGCFSFVVLSFSEELVAEEDLIQLIHSLFDVMEDEGV